MKRLFTRLIDWLRFVFGPQPMPTAETSVASAELENNALPEHQYGSKALCCRLENIAASLNHKYKTTLGTEDIIETCQALGIGWYMITQSNRNRKVVAPEDAKKICEFLSRRIIKLNTNNQK